MQALLSYDQSPPLAAPFRFFLTAPIYAFLAGILLLWSGPEIFLSRWTPGILALTHLMTVGFMMQVMLGAMVQILPVVAGANMIGPLWVCRVVHALINLGTLFLVAGFLSFKPWVFELAVLLLVVGVLAFVFAAARALYGVPATSPIITGLKVSLAGLCVTVGLGAALAAVFGWSLNLPLLQLADVHLVWGFAGWGMVLLAAVACVVVPMFQLTPSYPKWFERRFPPVLLSLIVLWSLADFFLPAIVASLGVAAIVLMAVGFSVLTLNIQRQSKRPNFDATQRYWRGGMVCTLATSAIWFAAQHLSVASEWQGWPLLCGVLLIFGGFMSVIVGMLYKIFPFLIWLHLQNHGMGRVMAPNMKKIIVETAMLRQIRAHFISCLLLLLAVVWPEYLVYASCVALIVSNGMLMHNLLSGMSVYREHLAKIRTSTTAVS